MPLTQDQAIHKWSFVKYYDVNRSLVHLILADLCHLGPTKLFVLQLNRITRGGDGGGRH